MGQYIGKKEDELDRKVTPLMDSSSVAPVMILNGKKSTFKDKESGSKEGDDLFKLGEFSGRAYSYGRESLDSSKSNFKKSKPLS